MNIELQDEESIPLAVISQEPAADSSDVESNTPIILQFNRPVDPSKLTIAVLETAHGKLFADQPEAADLSNLSEVKLVEVDRSRATVPGDAQNLPENQDVYVLSITRLRVWRNSLCRRDLQPANSESLSRLTHGPTLLGD